MNVNNYTLIHLDVGEENTDIIQIGMVCGRELRKNQIITSHKLHIHVRTDLVRPFLWHNITDNNTHQENKQNVSNN